MASQGSFWAASWNSFLIIQVEGFAAQNNSILFQDFVNEMVDKGYTQFIIDLSECRGMDSTFMGVLVGISNRIDHSDFPITLINVSPQNQKTLENLGLLCILDIKQETISLPPLKMKQLCDVEYDQKARIKMIREAHECLVKLNPENEKKFGQFLRILYQEEKKR